jgi:DNA-binding NtrC family response regulator
MTPEEQWRVLIVDDNRDLLHFLERLMAQSGWKLLTAETAEEGLELASRERPDVALLDYALPDENGVALAERLLEIAPGMPVLIMSGAELPGRDQITCEEYNFQILQKPLLAKEILSAIRDRVAEKRVNLAALDRDDDKVGQKPENFTVAFDPLLSAEQITAALTALADYYRACGGVGFRVEFELDSLVGEESFNVA